VARNDTEKKPWVRPQLRSESVQETLARPACQFKPPGHGGANPGRNKGNKPSGGWGPAFS
jgi:hypothetical protein